MDPTLMMLTTSAETVAEHAPDLPEPVTAAHRRYRAVCDLAVAELPAIEGVVLTTDPDDMEALIGTYVAEQLARDARPKITGPARTSCARALVNAVRGHGDAIIDAHAATFAKHGDKLTALVAELPHGYSDATVLVDNGPAAVEMFVKARAEADVLDAIAGWRDALADVDRSNLGRFEVVTRYGRFDDHHAATNAAEALRSEGEHPLGRFGVLIDNGASLCLATRAEQAATIARLEAAAAEDQKANPMIFSHLG